MSYIITPLNFDNQRVSYIENGIRIHKPVTHRLFSADSHSVTAEFIDIDTNKVTNRFYGSNSGIYEWFLGKAARGEKFNVIAFDGCEKLKVSHVCTEVGTIEQNVDGSWRKTAYEPISYCYGKPYLYNTGYSFTLSQSEHDAEIDKSLRNIESVIVFGNPPSEVIDSK